MKTCKFIITETDCYIGNATHGSTQHQGLLKHTNGNPETFFKFENGPADADRGISTIFEKEISPDTMQKIIKLKNNHFKLVENLICPTLDGGKPYAFADGLKSFTGMKKQKEKANSKYEAARCALLELSTVIGTLTEKSKKTYCKKVWELLDRPKDFEYFKSIFY